MPVVVLHVYRKYVSKSKKEKQLWESLVYSFKWFATPQKKTCGKWCTTHLHPLLDFFLSLKPVIHHPVSDQEKKNGWRLTFPVASAAPLSILLCVPLLSHLPLPSLQSPPSLAPALLMIPRKEAELAWGSKAIFPPFLCRFLLFVTAFHWNFQA